MKTRRDIILSIYESHKDGIIDKETRDLLLEACEDPEKCDDKDEKSDDDNDEDEIVDYKKTIEKLKEKVKEAKSEKSIKNIKDKAKESLEDLIDVADDEEIEKKLEKLYDDFIDEIEDDEDDEDNNSEEDGETIEERVNEVLLSIHEYHRAGYITESERDELLEIVNESLRDKIVTAAKNGKKIFDSDAMKGLSPDYKIDGLSTGLQMMKQGKLEQEEKARKEAELRKRLNFATANAGIGK